MAAIRVQEPLIIEEPAEQEPISLEVHHDKKWLHRFAVAIVFLIFLFVFGMGHVDLNHATEMLEPVCTELHREERLGANFNNIFYAEKDNIKDCGLNFSASNKELNSETQIAPPPTSLYRINVVTINVVTVTQAIGSQLEEGK